MSTKVTVAASGGDYTALDTAMDTEATDITAIATDLFDDVQVAFRIQCENFEDTTVVVPAAAWTTDATHLLLIEAMDNHGGKYGKKAYRLAVDSASRVIDLTSDVNDLAMAGLQIQNAHDVNDSGRGVKTQVTAAGIQRFLNLIIQNTSGIVPTTGANKALFINDSFACTTRVRNCIFSGFGQGLRYGGFHSGKVVISANNTSHGCFNGIDSGGASAANTTAKNNIIQETAPGGAAFVSVTNTSSNNISDDATSPDVAFRNKTVRFVNAPGRNFALASDDKEAALKGVDLSADATWPFNDDASRLLIPIRPFDKLWDIGALERVVARRIVRRRVPKQDGALVPWNFDPGLVGTEWKGIWQ